LPLAASLSTAAWSDDLAGFDEAFSSALNLEEKHLDQGWDDGLRCELATEFDSNPRSRHFLEKRKNTNCQSDTSRAPSHTPFPPLPPIPPITKPNRTSRILGHHRHRPRRRHSQLHREGEKLGHLDGREVGFAKGFEAGPYTTPHFSSSNLSTFVG
jgi:hypothetical protein